MVVRAHPIQINNRPARVEDAQWLASEVRRAQTANGQVPVYFFGDGTFGWIPPDAMRDYWEAREVFAPVGKKISAKLEAGMLPVTVNWLAMAFAENPDTHPNPANYQMDEDLNRKRKLESVSLPIDT